jgi:F420H(2)-dependent quinone reductase
MHKLIFKTATAINNALFRWSGGRVGGTIFGAPVLLLTVRGRKSGRQLTFPLLYLPDGGDLIVVASKGGAPDHPDWYKNLQACGSAVVELPHQRFDVSAETVSTDEKAQLWPRLVAMYGPYDTYQRWAGSRDIPVVRLRPCVNLQGAGA